VEKKSRRGGGVKLVELPIILSPERFLRELPIAEANGFWNWSWTQLSATMRADFNYDVARKVATKEDKARLARQNPEIVSDTSITARASQRSRIPSQRTLIYL
jgi:hypothetical protein